MKASISIFNTVEKTVTTYASAFDDEFFKEFFPREAHKSLWHSFEKYRSAETLREVYLLSVSNLILLVKEGKYIIVPDNTIDMGSMLAIIHLYGMTHRSDVTLFTAITDGDYRSAFISGDDKASLRHGEKISDAIAEVCVKNSTDHMAFSTILNTFLHKVDIDYDKEYFCCSKVHRADLLEKGFDGNSVSDEVMEKVAKQMSISLTEIPDYWWDVLEGVCEKLRIPKL